MHFIRIVFNVCERLFEELVKELLKDRFTVVSGSGAKLCVWKWIYEKHSFLARKKVFQRAFAFFASYLCSKKHPFAICLKDVVY